MKYFFHFLTAFILISSFQGTLAAKQSVSSDSLQVEVRKPEVSSITEYRTDPRFQYTDVKAEPETLWERFKRWLFQKIFAFLNKPGVQQVLKVIFYVVIGLVIIALINQFINGNISGAFFDGSSKTTNRLKYSDHIEKIDFDALLRKALAEQHYQEAVSIMYNKALKQLSELKLIDWKSDKTNHDYLYELKQHASKPYFSEMTHIYEYVEYGDFPVTQKDFELIKVTFDKFSNSLDS